MAEGKTYQAVSGIPKTRFTVQLWYVVKDPRCVPGTQMLLKAAGARSAKISFHFRLFGGLSHHKDHCIFEEPRLHVLILTIAQHAWYKSRRNDQLSQRQ